MGDEDLTDRAVRSATAVAAVYGVRCDDPVILADGYSTVVHLRPSPVVARVPTLYRMLRPGAAWRRREVEVVRHLQSVGAAVVPLSAELPSGPHVHDGLTVTFWEYVPAVGDVEVTERDLAPALAELHQALATYPGDLPVLAGPRHDIPHCLAVLATDPGPLDAAQVATLQGVHARLRPFVVDPPGDRQPLHGDVFPGNVIAGRDGLLWSDLEDTCLGPRAWDIANLRPDPVDRSALDAYPDAPDDDEIDTCAELRTLQVATWVSAAPRPPGISRGDQASSSRLCWPGGRPRLPGRCARGAGLLGGPAEGDTARHTGSPRSAGYRGFTAPAGRTLTRDLPRPAGGAPASTYRPSDGVPSTTASAGSRATTARSTGQRS